MMQSNQFSETGPIRGNGTIGQILVRARGAVFALIAVAAMSAPASADYLFAAGFSGLNEVPPLFTVAVGQGLFDLNSTESQLTFHITYTGLQPSVLANSGFYEAPAGSNGPLVHAFSPAEISGLTYPNGSITGTWSFNDAQPLTTTFVSDLFAGNIYVNILTTAVPTGEIRGQLRFQSAVPEPASLLLLSLGAIGIIQLMRRRTISPQSADSGVIQDAMAAPQS
jgi:hypothetical protein